jgi:hypothetical protein
MMCPDAARPPSTVHAYAARGLQPWTQWPAHVAAGQQLVAARKQRNLAVVLAFCSGAAASLFFLMSLVLEPSELLLIVVLACGLSVATAAACVWRWRKRSEEVDAADEAINRARADYRLAVARWLCDEMQSEGEAADDAMRVLLPNGATLVYSPSALGWAVLEGNRAEVHAMADVREAKMLAASSELVVDVFFKTPELPVLSVKFPVEQQDAGKRFYAVVQAASSRNSAIASA